MQQDIFDARLQHYLRRILDKLDDEKKLQLKSLRLCNHSVMYQPNVQPAVFLLRSDGFDGSGDAKFFGQMTCKNPWACPCCSTKMMNKYKEKIALAIDALRDEKAKQRFFGFMVTFTIPHLRFQSCKEVTDILYNTFREFWRNAWKRRKQKSDPSKLRTHGPANDFVVGCDVRFHVRCAEYTWGKQNGWHPHFHNIYWVPRGNQNKVLEFQEKLNAGWLAVAERETLKYWDEHELHGDTHEKREQKCKCLFMFKKDDLKHPAVKISTDINGKIKESLSSDYLAGWGSDSEVTGNYKKKASHKSGRYEHFTPYEILERAADGDKEMEKLYIEYCLQVTRKPVHHRVDFRVGMIKDIIIPYKQTEGYKKVVKKKQERQWELVCWFSKEQWFSLCSNKDSPILSNILYLAAINRKDLLIEFLQAFDIYLLPYEHFFQQHVVNIFNGVAKKVA